jgi:hypothetical protein
MASRDCDGRRLFASSFSAFAIRYSPNRRQRKSAGKTGAFELLGGLTADQ